MVRPHSAVEVWTPRKLVGAPGGWFLLTPFRLEQDWRIHLPATALNCIQRQSSAPGMFR
jgi:hypothetical protein